MSANISDFSRPISLVPVGGNNNPAVPTDEGKKSFIWNSDVWSHVLLVNAIADATAMKLVYDFGAVPVFVKIESWIRQPSL
jgi:hypothetical protein